MNKPALGARRATRLALVLSMVLAGALPQQAIANGDPKDLNLLPSSVSLFPSRVRNLVPSALQLVPSAIDLVPESSQWRMPLSNVRVSSFFGALRGRRAHGGVDFSIPRDTPVMATDRGIVVASTNRYEGDSNYGNVVVIEHDQGVRSLYAHLNARHVNVGDEVAAGDTIGLSGNTGRSTGPHLHLEAFRSSARIDPGELLLASLEDHALPSALHAKRIGFEAAGSAKGKVGQSAKAGSRSKKNPRPKRASAGHKRA
jgi:murein DD-endopeptidase MepM/ murein hydrolase activator NlpD